MQNKILSLIFRNDNISSFDFDVEPALPGRITSSKGGFEVAGFGQDGKYRILSRKTGQLVDIAPKQLDKATLFAHIGQDYCTRHFTKPDPETGGREFDLNRLIFQIRQECDNFGPANLEDVRGPGLYLDDSGLVVNYGDAVFDQADNPVSTKPTPTRAYVSGQGLGFSRETPCATADEVEAVEQAFRSFAFEQNWGDAASLGWFASSVLGAVLPNSPSIILTAEKGAGKSTWVSLQVALLGQQAILRDGVPSAPQVLHAVSEKSVTLICDEFEPLKRSKAQLESLTEVFNSGFTKSTGKGKFTRVSGKSLRYFNPPSGVALCGINVPELDDALESRSVRLSMVRKDRAGESKCRLLNTANGEARLLGARLRRLLVSRWQVVRDTRAQVHEMLQSIGHSDRFADTYSPLVAGYIGLKHAAVPERHVLEELLAQWSLNEVRVDELDTPSEACLSTLLDRKVVIKVREGGVRQHWVALALRDSDAERHDVPAPPEACAMVGDSGKVVAENQPFSPNVDAHGLSVLSVDRDALPGNHRLQALFVNRFARDLINIDEARSHQHGKVKPCKLVQSNCGNSAVQCLNNIGQHAFAVSSLTQPKLRPLISRVSQQGVADVLLHPGSNICVRQYLRQECVEANRRVSFRLETAGQTVRQA